ncbi:MAG: GNAT family N-acetyltransferase [Dermabacteraceae bacterium]
MFSALITGQRLPAAFDPSPGGELLVVVDPDRSQKLPLSLLHLDDAASGILALSPHLAEQLGLVSDERLDRAELEARLERAGLELASADHLFHLPLSEQERLRAEPWGEDTRELTAADADAFDAFTALAPEGDLDEAFVELDHWLVVGTFRQQQLVSVSSMYPWGETAVADLGVITLPTFRGQGLGRATVRAISAAALSRGYEPQYRCDLDNAPSAALARAAGFARFGLWEGLEDGE